MRPALHRFCSRMCGSVLDGEDVVLKFDLRCYAYAGVMQMVAARLWQGQTTNFRTPGGGFTPVAEVE